MCRKRDPTFESSRLESQIEKPDFTPVISRVSSLMPKLVRLKASANAFPTSLSRNISLYNGRYNALCLGIKTF